MVSGGFADAGEEGKAFQSEIIEIARGGNARIIGPNSMGIANSQNRLNTAFVSEMQMKETSLGVICQSGLFFCGLPDMHLVGKIIDLGNCCDIGFADGLAYLEDDPATKLILLHIEGIKDGKRFMEISKRVSGKKPIFALKTGKSEAGASAAQSHSGSMVGMDEVYDAVFKQCGIMLVLPAMNSDSWNLLETTPKLAMRYKEKPIVCWMYGNRYHEYSDELEKNGGIAAFSTIERAILALARLYEYGKIKEKLQNSKRHTYPI